MSVVTSGKPRRSQYLQSKSSPMVWWLSPVLVHHVSDSALLPLCLFDTLTPFSVTLCLFNTFAINMQWLQRLVGEPWF